MTAVGTGTQAGPSNSERTVGYHGCPLLGFCAVFGLGYSDPDTVYMAEVWQSTGANPRPGQGLLGHWPGGQRAHFERGSLMVTMGTTRYTGSTKTTLTYLIFMIR